MIPPVVLQRLHELVESSTELAELIPSTPRTRVTLTAQPAAPPIERRDQWNALPPKSNPGSFTSLDATVAHYTAGSHGYMVRPDEPHDWCREQVRAIQRQHQAIAEQSDIEYNALCCAHGVLFEGRVAGYKGGANGSAESNRTMPSCCALIGVDDVPPDPLLYALSWFHAVVQTYAARPLDMYGHGDVFATSCPGGPLSRWVDAGGYRTMTPTPPEPPTDLEDPMAFLIAAINHPGYPPATQVVYVSDWIERRWVRNESELAVMTGAGLAAPIVVDCRMIELDAFGELVGPQP